MTKHTDEFSQFTEPVTCRECTLPRDEKSTDPKGWIRGNTKIGPVLEVTTSYLQGNYGVEIRIESVNKDNSHSWVRISHGVNKLVTDLIDKENATTIPWNLAKPAKTYPGIILRQHRTDRKLMGLLREQCAEWKKGHLRHCCSPVWTTNGGRIPWNNTAICEKLGETFWWENTFRKAVRNAFYRISNTVWSNGRISPYFCERPVATASSVRLKSLTRSFSRLCVIRGEKMERRYYGRGHWRNGGDGRIWTPCQKAQC